ncbi:MAG: hypothetical protein V1900_03210 [Candidatus Aenigmatarchaeota archaeon]
MKAMVPIDYILAAGIFLVLFAYIINYTTSYYSTVKDVAEIMTLRSEALGLLSIADRGPEPENWTNAPERLGLQSYAYRFYILVNNSAGYRINASEGINNIEDELVRFNLSSLGYTIDLNSIAIYDEYKNPIGYQRNGDNITFAVSINASQSIFFVVYFDDDSNFTSSSAAVSGSNNITETIYPVERFSLLQYRKILKLNASTYATVKGNCDIENDFNIQIYDTDRNQTYVSYGGASSRAGNIVALSRYVVFQNASASINNGKLTVKVW